MAKGKKAFRIIICILLVLIILCSAFFDALFILHIDRNFLGEWSGVSVAGVDVTRSNKDDILGDGTVSYNKAYNALTLNNAYDLARVHTRAYHTPLPALRQSSQ